jgi:hypothetical protein
LGPVCAVAGTWNEIELPLHDDVETMAPSKLKVPGVDPKLEPETDSVWPAGTLFGEID